MARWNTCNILQLAPDARRLWQFDAKGAGFVLTREQRVPHTEALPARGVAKQWSSLWQPKLNIAWLPPENIFLRVVELPASSAEETYSMVELQLEKISPLPVTQIVWTMQPFGTHQSPPKPDGTVESLQTVIVVIAARSVVEEFLGRLEKDGFLADRLEVSMLDQLATVESATDGAWLFPQTLGGQNAALVAWWGGGALRSLSFVTLPAAGERAKELKDQLAHIAWFGELEGWLPAVTQWHLVADPVNASEWETVLRAGLNEPVKISPPPAPAELAARTATRATTTTSNINLLPAEFTTRYHQQFVDRLWLRGLVYAGLAYAVGLLIYFGAVSVLNYQTHGVEQKVVSLGGSYTNALQLKARFGVLQERSQLKYAALDCWQLVAQELTPGIELKRTSFADGRKLSLSGQVASTDTQKLLDFYDALRKAKLNGQTMFDPNPGTGDQLVYRQQSGSVVWNFGLELQHGEAVGK